jgi:ribonucleoside-diphosphate reductase alpha chain
MTEKYYWLNKDSRKFLERGYLLEGETPEQRVRDIAEAAEKYLQIKGFADKFEDYVAKGFYSLSSPVWSNFGRKRGLPISCFGSYISDTMESILYKVAEVGIMTKHGGGTSAYFGDIRGRGTPISCGGESTGSVHFMELYNKLMNVVSQGNVRRGSFAAYLPIDHKDIEEFLEIRSEGHDIQEMSFGVCVSDQWMKKMVDGDKEKRKIWSKVIKKRFESGYPYIMFSDTANKNAPQIYKDKGLTVHNSNLCVTGDTLITILINDLEERQIQIKDLTFYMKKFDNVKVKGYNIEEQKVEFEKIEAFAQTGETDELYEIEDELGNIIRCTPEHQIYTKNRGYVMAKDLKEDDVIQNE